MMVKTKEGDELQHWRENLRWSGSSQVHVIEQI
jgi:hypothetical protein